MKTTPHWETCAAIVGRLEAGGTLTKSDISDLKGGIYQMQLWFERVQQLQKENEDARLKRHEHDNALEGLEIMLLSLSKFARQQIGLDNFVDVLREKAKFEKIISAYGRKSIGEPLPPKRTSRAKT